VDALGRTTQYTYDAMDRLIQTNYPDGTTANATYNWRGHPLTATDQGGHVTAYGYDLAGQLLAVTAADISTTQSAYDATGAQDQLDRSARPRHHLHLRQRGPPSEDHQRAEPEHNPGLRR